jgi:hypothetical protein
MQRLVNISDQVKQLDQVVGSNIVRNAGDRRQSRREFFDLCDRIYRVLRRDWSAVRRKIDVLVVPVLVHQLARVANVLTRLLPVGRIVAIGIAMTRKLDVVGPYRSTNEGVLLDVARCNTGNPRLVISIELYKSVDFLSYFRCKTTVNHGRNLHMATVPPGICCSGQQSLAE